jgi:toxin-antitoxin system PIN domain toxin
VVALLDINVLVALFDPAHIRHGAAHDWFGRHRARGWATCPLTENGLIRVISSAAYPGRRTSLPDAVERLQAFRRSTGHVFWEDSISLCEASLVETTGIAGGGQLTDVYLLALAVRNGGRLATFDRRVSAAAVIGAEARHLALIDGDDRG